jgi:hypothetical protein
MGAQTHTHICINNCFQTSSIGYGLNLNVGIAVIVKPAMLAVGNLASNETTFHCTLLW